MRGVGGSSLMRHRIGGSSGRTYRGSKTVESNRDMVRFSFFLFELVGAESGLHRNYWVWRVTGD